MNRYDLQDLIRMWARERLTPEQAMGQVLLHLDDLNKRVTAVERRGNHRPPRGHDEGQESKKE